MPLVAERTLQLPRAAAVSHAWSHDRALLACCHGGPEVALYCVTADGAPEQIATLREHNQTVAAMHWSRSGLLVTCSHDRTSYVWRQVRGFPEPAGNAFVAAAAPERWACNVMSSVPLAN